MREFLHQVSGALMAYGPWGVCLLAVIDSVGIPLPAAIDALLIGVAASSAQSPHTAYFTALLAVVGSLGGNIALFHAARHGRKLMQRSEPAPGKRRRFQQWFHRYGLATVFIPGIIPLVPLPLKVFVVSAGALHTPFVRFVLVILTARAVRYFGLAYLGLQLGLDAQGFLIRNGWRLAGAVLALAFVLCLLVRKVQSRRGVDVVGP